MFPLLSPEDAAGNWLCGLSECGISNGPPWIQEGKSTLNPKPERGNLEVVYMFKKAVCLAIGGKGL